MTQTIVDLNEDLDLKLRALVSLNRADRNLSSKSKMIANLISNVPITPGLKKAIAEVKKKDSER